MCVCVTALHYAAAAEQFDVCMSLPKLLNGLNGIRYFFSMDWSV